MVKQFPLYFLPLVLVLTKRTQWVRIVVACAVPAIVAYGTWGVLFPGDFVANLRALIDYRGSVPSDFGTAYLVPQTVGGGAVLTALTDLSLLTAFVAMLIAWRRKLPLLDGVTITMLTVCVVTPRTSPQYLTWPLALMVAMNRTPRVVVMTLGLFVPFVLYFAYGGMFLSPSPYYFVVGDVVVAAVTCLVLRDAVRDAAGAPSKATA
jgi:hypothetical protein